MGAGERAAIAAHDAADAFDFSLTWMRDEGEEKGEEKWQEITAILAVDGLCEPDGDSEWQLRSASTQLQSHAHSGSHPHGGWYLKFDLTLTCDLRYVSLRLLLTSQGGR